jgi:phosphoglycerate dehydrogenase-like enzyme
MHAAVIIGDDDLRAAVYPPDLVAGLAGSVRWLHPGLDAAALAHAPALLDRVEVIFGTWGMPVLDAGLLAAAPRLRAVFYAAGSVRGFVTDAFWQRGIVLSTAAAANAIPVAEYCLAWIILGLKQVYPIQQQVRRERRFLQHLAQATAGACGSTVGLVSYGAIARVLRRLLRALEVRVLVYDPFLDADAAAREEVELVALAELFRRSQVVSLHTPWLPATENLVRAEHLRQLPANAVFINSARGAVVHEGELCAVLAERPDLFAVLDVTHPEPPALDHPLFDLPNAFLTPHMAGSVGGERRRLGRCMVGEFQRWHTGQPLQHQLDRDRAEHMA